MRGDSEGKILILQLVSVIEQKRQFIFNENDYDSIYQAISIYDRFLSKASKNKLNKTESFTKKRVKSELRKGMMIGTSLENKLICLNNVIYCLTNL